MSRRSTGVSVSPDSEEDNYFIPISDLMIGLLFIFIILLMAYAIRYQEALGKPDPPDPPQPWGNECPAIAPAGEPCPFPIPPELVPEPKPEPKGEGEGWGHLCSEFTAGQLLDTIRQFGRGGVHVPRTPSSGTSANPALEFQACVLSRLPDIIEAYKRRLLDTLLGQIQDEAKNRGLKVDIVPESGVLRLPEEILFASGKAEVSDEGKSNIRRLAIALKQSVPCFTPDRQNIDNCGADTAAVLETILVEGHTDDDPYANDPEGNWKLSTQRALNTFRHLVATWPGLESLNGVRGVPMLGLSGYAEKRPTVPNTDPKGKQKNRRIDLRFIVTADHLLDEARVKKTVWKRKLECS